MKTLLISFPDNKQQAQSLANASGLQYASIELRRFPDGESYVRLPNNLPDHVVIFCTLSPANDKLIELMLVSETAKQQHVKRLSLISPYLCYMRQDQAFHSGEAISQTIIGRFLAEHFEDLITVDPHLHRVNKLSDATPIQNPQVLTAAGLISKYIKTNLKSTPILLGPDSESEQWVKQVAKPDNLDYIIATKTRFGDRDVNVDVPGVNLKDREVIIIDDIASTGNTLIEAAKQISESGIKHLYAVVTHALLDEQALSALKESGVETIWSTNTLPHSSNVIDIEPVLVDAVLALTDQTEKEIINVQLG